jgi:hypothetical protein
VTEIAVPLNPQVVKFKTPEGKPHFCWNIKLEKKNSIQRVVLLSGGRI